MDKAHYIARYGEEAYKNYLKRCSENKKRIKMGLPRLKKTKPINNITVKVKANADLSIPIPDRIAEQEKVAWKLQRRLASYWKSKTTKPFILVVDSGNVVSGTTSFSYRINLTQLDLKEEEIKAFQDGVVKEANDFLNK